MYGAPAKIRCVRGTLRTNSRVTAHKQPNYTIIPILRMLTTCSQSRIRCAPSSRVRLCWQMRIVKQRLLEMMPKLQCFLDVDDCALEIRMSMQPPDTSPKQIFNVVFWLLLCQWRILTISRGIFLAQKSSSSFAQRDTSAPKTASEKFGQQLRSTNPWSLFWILIRRQEP